MSNEVKKKFISKGSLYVIEALKTSFAMRRSRQFTLKLLQIPESSFHNSTKFENFASNSYTIKIVQLPQNNLLRQWTRSDIKRATKNNCNLNVEAIYIKLLHLPTSLSTV